MVISTTLHKYRWSVYYLPDDTECSAGKRITSGRSSLKQRAGSNLLAQPGPDPGTSHFVVLLFATELSPSSLKSASMTWFRKKDSRKADSGCRQILIVA